MKPKKFNKKLALNKKTIVNLGYFSGQTIIEHDLRIKGLTGLKD